MIRLHARPSPSPPVAGVRGGRGAESTTARKLGPLKIVQSSLLVIVMNVPRSFWKRNQNFKLGIVPEFVLLRTNCFDLVQNLISFDGADSGTNSDVLVSFLLDVGTSVERTVLTLLYIQ